MTAVLVDRVLSLTVSRRFRDFAVLVVPFCGCGSDLVLFGSCCHRAYLSDVILNFGCLVWLLSSAFVHCCALCVISIIDWLFNQCNSCIYVIVVSCCKSSLLFISAYSCLHLSVSSAVLSVSHCNQLISSRFCRPVLFIDNCNYRFFGT